MMTYLVPLDFAAQQDCAGFAQFEWSTTWKEEDGSFFQVGRFGMVGASAAALAGARQVDGRVGSGWDVGSDDAA